MSMKRCHCGKTAEEHENGLMCCHVCGAEPGIEKYDSPGSGANKMFEIYCSNRTDEVLYWIPLPEPPEDT